MKIRPSFSSGSVHRSSGFSLVELLVVLAIIAVLAALTAAGVFQVIEGQKQSNTEQTIRVLNKALRQQMDRVIQDANNSTIDPVILQMAANDTNRAKVLNIKWRLKQEFPQNFAEAFANPSYQETLQQLGVSQPGATQLCEPSVCLLLILERARSGVSFNKDLLGSGAIQDGTYNDQNNGAVTVQQVVDGWGNPLRFLRWPDQPVITDLDTMNPTVAEKGSFGYLYRDPQDPDGYLVNKWWGSVGSQQFEPQTGGWGHSLTGATGPGGTPGPESHNRIPIIWSIGRYPVTTEMNPLLDQGFIYSYRLRTGARGD
jgi:prepilin-type N-terminal cleavage/methylation domain-containing protein